MQIFSELVDACRTEPSFTKIETLDAKMASKYGLSAFRSLLLLELLVYVANTMQNWPVLEGLVEQGPPGKPPPREPTMQQAGADPDAACRNLHETLALIRRGGGHKSWFVVAKMLRSGWLASSSSYARCVYTIAPEDGGEQEATALFDALVATGFLPAMPDSPRPKVELLLWLTGCITSKAPVSLLRHIAAAVPFAASAERPSELLHAAVSDDAARSRGAAGTRGLLAFLIDEQGMDPDGTAQRTELRLAAGTARYQETALHAAVYSGNLAALQYLLERGAKIVRDGEGKTPFERAVLLDRYRVVRFFADYFQEKKLGFLYVYEEPREPEDLTGRHVDWRANLSLLASAAPPLASEDDYGDWVSV